MSKQEEQITINVGLDENNVPDKLSWKASQIDKQNETGAAILSFWDRKEKSAMRIDLWDKEFTTDEMKMLIHQTLLTLADSYERATSEKDLSEKMRDFGHFFGIESGIVQEG